MQNAFLKENCEKKNCHFGLPLVTFLPALFEHVKLHLTQFNCLEHKGAKYMLLTVDSLRVSSVLLTGHGCLSPCYILGLITTVNYRWRY